MKKMSLFVVLCLVLAPFLGLAAEVAAPVVAPVAAVVAPAVEAAPVVVAPVVAAPEIPVTDFFTQVFEAIKGFGGFSWWMKISAICLLLVSSMRVSILKPLWDKLGAAKIALAPLLAMIIGVVSLASVDGKISGAAVMAYLLAGGGSIILHQLLDAIKELPMVGPKYDAWIDVLKSLLGAKKV